MAARRKTSSRTPSETAGQTDPRAPLDGRALLAAAGPVLKLLAKDLKDRAEASPAVTAALESQHATERAARRTADPFPVWLGAFVDQVAAAWFLSCVFARTLEDRGLVAHARLAGPGAADSQRLFFDLAPSLAERDYLLTVFRELSRFPAARDLFDAKHNPVWLLTPSAEAAKALLGLFRTPSAEAPAFRFGQADTHFLADLYQDMNEEVQKRYALLQTPRFVESFILDRTLERAIDRFGLDETTLIDPTCGGGHFLLGTFERLYDHRLRAEPGLGEREAARKALDAVYGADINPYAVAIARFRLTLAYLEKAGYSRLGDAPALPLHVVVADSLLHNPQLVQRSFQDLEGQSAEAWAGKVYALEDERAAREVLHRRYAAVVGNPPYITVKDSVLRERYREMYSPAAGKSSRAAPCAQRFFQRGREGGAVGMITANSFMKREFGKKLIEEYLPTVNLDLIVNTSGAYIPGHGTPTVLLFGTSEAAQGTDVLAVLAKRGEPTTPEKAEEGLVWRSIAEHWKEVGFENDYVSVARVERTGLGNHPWSLGGGGAKELKDLLEERAVKRLGDVTTSIGISCVTGEDDVYLLPSDAVDRLRAGRTIPLVTGEYVRDWTLSPAGECVFPYDDEFRVLEPKAAVLQLTYLWAFRSAIRRRRRFGVPMVERGLSWYELQELYADKLRTPVSIVFAFVATHNHFVLDRGGKVFKQTAPIIKLPEKTTEDDHLALLAYLNSSTACFWLKQVMMNKGGSGIGRGVQDEAWESRFEFDGTKIAQIPLPANMSSLALLSRDMLDLVEKRKAVAPEHLVKRARESERPSADILAESRREDARLLRRMTQLQERIDFEVYRLFGLIDQVPPMPSVVAPGSRFFEVEMVGQKSQTTWFARHGLPAPDPDLPALSDLHLPPEVLLMEQPDFKRRWAPRDWEADVSAARRFLALDFLEEYISARVEIFSGRAVVRYVVRGAYGGETLVPEGGEPELVDLMGFEAVPYIAALRYSDTGYQKRAAWEHTWDLQRREDRGEKPGDIPVPPKYDPKDFRDPVYFRLRGKLDVPKERFISYPGCESDQDGEPVYGWAGWNHLQQAQALAALYQKRKTEEAWTKDRLTPMLAGLLELLPWIQQWHNAPSDEYAGMRLGDFFQTFIDGECSTLGLTREDLTTWRPDPRKRQKPPTKARPPAPSPSPDTDEDASPPAPPDSLDPAPTSRSTAAQKAREPRRKRKQPTPAED